MYTRTLIACSLLLVALTGCESRAEQEAVHAERIARYQREQATRKVIFQDCLARIPKGPERTQYNDWSEVVESCDNIARGQSSESPFY